MSRLPVILLVALAGFGLGLAYGRLVAPVEYVDADPASLRIDYRSDYVLMVAERYAADHDAVGALRRLEVLGIHGPIQATSEAIQFGQSAQYAPQDLDLIQRLFRAVQEQTLHAPTAVTAP
jgi:hypothetical protein